ncbi:DUF1840 family protein [Dechloromonas sp. ZY10]|uniref:DUF1840 family protein n=1 Tax=Dechloromonas aquae TaxID=2664436 RepID=UPI003527D170
MLVRFESSETGEILMYAETARALLQAMGKECTARGVFLQPEMLAAAAALREAMRAAPPAPDEAEEAECRREKKPLPVSFGQRAWPLLDALERTAKAGPEANIIWEAASDF